MLNQLSSHSLPGGAGDMGMVSQDNDMLAASTDQLAQFVDRMDQ